MKRPSFPRPVSAAGAMIAFAAMTLASTAVTGSEGEYLFVTDWDEHTVLRYDAVTGEFVDEFVPKKVGGLNDPVGLVLGPHDGNLYVSSGELSGNGQLTAVARYDGTTGEPIDAFAGDGDLVSPRGVVFGPDGNLYVADRPVVEEGRIVRYDGITGELLGDFVPNSSGTLSNPIGLVFGPSGNNPNQLDLYVANAWTSSVSRFDGTTGAFLGDFVPSSAGVLDRPLGLTFGPDGNLYVANWASGARHMAVLRFQGPDGDSPGAPFPSEGNNGADFIAPGSGGLLAPQGLIFGPDGNGDGYVDLYVANMDVNGSFKANQNTGTVKRYDGLTGAFIDTFITANSGGLRDPFFLTFSQTDPTTLEYLGSPAQVAASHAVPEPSGLLLVGLGIVATIGNRRRRRVRPGRRMK